MLPRRFILYAVPLRRRLTPALALAAVATGCGGASHHAGSNASDYAQAVKYSDCMRSHGVPDFPDPDPGGGFPLRTSGIEPGSPAYRSASIACARLEPGGSKPPPITPAQQAGMVAKAHCLRAHGVPSFPDPSFNPGGMGVDNHLTGTWNPRAPAVVAAAKACVNVGTLIPGTGV